MCLTSYGLTTADIILSTLNAKYIHSAFGLRYLLANLGPLRPRACLAEFDINQRPVDIAEALLARNPRIIGLGIYIWNVAPSTELVATIKKVRPETVVILGGPEVSLGLGHPPRLVHAPECSLRAGKGQSIVPTLVPSTFALEGEISWPRGGYPLPLRPARGRA